MNWNKTRHDIVDTFFSIYRSIYSELILFKNLTTSGKYCIVKCINESANKGKYLIIRRKRKKKIKKNSRFLFTYKIMRGIFSANDVSSQQEICMWLIFF